MREPKVLKMVEAQLNTQWLEVDGWLGTQTIMDSYETLNWSFDAYTSIIVFVIHALE